MTRSGRCSTRLLATALVLFVAAAVAGGDEDVAEFLFGKAEKAYRAKDYEQAEEYYRKALAEHSPYPKACYGLARSLEKQGRTEEAIAVYLKCQEEVGALPSPSRTLRRLADKARKAVSKLGKAYADLQEIDREFVKEAMALGRRFMRSDPAWAKKCFEAVLLVDPNHALAQSFMDRLKEEVAAAATAGMTPMIRDNKLSNWDLQRDEDTWKCTGGVIRVRPGNTKGHTIFVKSTLAGAFTYRATFRVTRPGHRPVHGLTFASKKGDKGALGLLIAPGGEFTLTSFGKDGSQDLRNRLLPHLDEAQWHVIEAEVKPGEISCVLDGVEQFRHTEKDAEFFDGSFGLFVQDADVEIKEVMVKQ